MNESNRRPTRHTSPSRGGTWETACRCGTRYCRSGWPEDAPLPADLPDPLPYLLAQLAAARGGRDPVVIALRIACVIAACAIAFLIVTGCQRHQAQAALHCPPQDHPVWASSLHQWLCGSSQTIGVKSR